MGQQKVSIHTLLETFVQSKEEVPFLWGFNDCCTFASDWAEMVTGVDPMEELRGLTDPLVAMRTLNRLGGTEQVVSGRFKTSSCPKAGDIVLFRGAQETKTLGVCLGERSAFPGPDGLTYINTNLTGASWCVA
jgi:hypothetical protein